MMYSLMTLAKAIGEQYTRIRILAVILLLLFSSLSLATNAYRNFSITYLQGQNCEVGDSDRQIRTFENKFRDHCGDALLFFDRSVYENDDTGLYDELSVRAGLFEFDDHLSKSSMWPVKWKCARSVQKKATGLASPMVNMASVRI